MRTWAMGNDVRTNRRPEEATEPKRGHLKCRDGQRLRYDERVLTGDRKHIAGGASAPDRGAAVAPPQGEPPRP